MIIQGVHLLSLMAPENIVNDNSGGSSSSLMAPENIVNENSGGFHFIYHHSHFDFAYSLLPTPISPKVKYDFIPITQKKNCFCFVLFGLINLISTYLMITKRIQLHKKTDALFS